MAIAEQRGPQAPKDPVMKGSYFYIMMDKDIFGAPQPDGRGIQFIYENDNRLINSAKIVGNIDDENMLNMLKTTEDFKKMVKAIGVSVMESSSSENVRFVFQMYGKTDTYGSGTSIIKDMKADGAEVLISMDEIEWSSDDKEPGQIRFEFDKAQVQAQASVRFYLHDGFNAPEVVMDEKIDETSDNYKEMISRSLMQLGNTARLHKAIDKAKSGKDVTLAFIGGSITQGAGSIPINHKSYAYQTLQGFAQRFGTGENVHFVKAGVGGTPSELGMIRFERDVLRDGNVTPDVIVIEFAVNDEGDETKGVCYESLVRKCLSLPNKPAVILLFAVFANDWNLQDRLSPVGRLYNIPMVSVMDAVTPQFKLTKEQGRVLSKNQFFYDIFHPTNAGHKIMAESILHLCDVVATQEAEQDNTDELLLQKAVIGADFENVKLLDKKDLYDKATVFEGAFDETDTELQGVEMDDKLEQVPQFPHNWMYTGVKEGKPSEFKLQIKCKALLLVSKDSGATNVGKAEAYVDGKHVLTADPHINGWTHCNPLILLNEAESKEHEITISMAEGDEDKRFTILGFGYVE